jgi:pilus assembly protein CpaC
MSFVNGISKLGTGRRLARKALEIGTAALLAASALTATSALLTSPARAGDLDFSTSGAPGDEGQFVRIGLNKSIVIRLPADARDVIVGNPAIVDAVVRTKNTAYLFGRGVGQTNIFFFDGAGNQILNLDLEVALDMKALQKLIDRTLPGSQITVDTVNQNVILGGTASSAAEAKLAEDLATKFVSVGGEAAGVVNTINVTGGDQVMLKVRVVEVQRDVVKNLGISLDKLAMGVGQFAFNMSTFNPFTTTAPLNGSVGFASSNGKFDIQSSIQALESTGLLRTLAEPNLSAVSGQPATFHAGGEFPMRTRTCDQGLCTDTWTYKEYGVNLGFTPVVLSEGRISLKIDTTVSEVTDPVTFALNSRSASTTLEMPSGGTMMIAGLLKDVNQQNIEGTPGLKNLPVLGALFRSRAYQSHQTEMAVLVTPYIVNPGHMSDFVDPDKDLGVATDRQANIFGRINRVYGTPGKHPNGVYHGSVGYIVE